MALYRITAPDGNDYEIEGPEGASKNEIVSAVQSKLREQSITEGLAGKYKSDPSFLDNVGAGLGSGFVGTLESGALGAATLLAWLVPAQCSMLNSWKSKMNPVRST